MSRLIDRAYLRDYMVDSREGHSEEYLLKVACGEQGRGFVPNNNCVVCGYFDGSKCLFSDAFDAWVSGGQK